MVGESQRGVRGHHSIGSAGSMLCQVEQVCRAIFLRVVIAKAVQRDQHDIVLLLLDKGVRAVVYGNDRSNLLRLGRDGEEQREQKQPKAFHSHKSNGCHTLLSSLFQGCFKRILRGGAFQPMSRRHLALLGVLSMAASTISGIAETAKLKVPEIKYESYTLPNGLQVILSEDHRLPIVGVDIWYHVGPMNERAGRTGFAHLFEHMMFQGSKHVGEKAQIRTLEAAGASDINGTTEPDRTNYFETLPSNQLETALWIESDRMGYLLDTLSREKLANQRDVVRNERRQGENTPYELVEEGLFHQVYPKGHPYH